MTTTATHQHVWTATLAEDDKRAELWLEAFGGLTVPVQSPIPEAGNLPGLGIVAILKVDFSCLGDRQAERAAEVCGARFGMTRGEALREFRERGLPLIWDGLLVTSCCGYAAHDDYARPEPEEFKRRLYLAMRALRDDDRPVALQMTPLQALIVAGLLQIALKHPGTSGDPLGMGIEIVKGLHREVCPPGSSLEQLAMKGWVGRGGDEVKPTGACCEHGGRS